jgi:hypothetical protein
MGLHRGDAEKRRNTRRRKTQEREHKKERTEECGGRGVAGCEDFALGQKPPERRLRARLPAPQCCEDAERMKRPERENNEERTEGAERTELGCLDARLRVAVFSVLASWRHPLSYRAQDHLERDSLLSSGGPLRIVTSLR